MTRQEHVRFEPLATLQTVEDRGEQRVQSFRFDRVENGSHLSVTRDVLNAVDASEIFVGIRPTFVKREQRWILQRKHRKGRHQCVRQQNVQIFALIGLRDRGEFLSHGCNQTVCRKFLPHLPA